MGYKIQDIILSYRIQGAGFFAWTCGGFLRLIVAVNVKESFGFPL